MFYLPAFFGLAAQTALPGALGDARMLPALAISWVGLRGVYRLGYMSNASIYRLAGAAGTVIPGAVLTAYLISRLFSNIFSGTFVF